MVTSTDPCAAVRTHGCDLRVAGNFYGAATACATAYSGTLISAVRGHIGMVCNKNAACTKVATANSSTAGTCTGCSDLGIAGNDDVGGIAAFAATDPGCIVAARSRYISIAGDGNIGGIAATGSAADASTA